MHDAAVQDKIWRRLWACANVGKKYLGQAVHPSCTHTQMLARLCTCHSYRCDEGAPVRRHVMLEPLLEGTCKKLKQKKLTDSSLQP